MKYGTNDYIISIFRLYHSADTWAAVCIATMKYGTNDYIISIFRLYHSADTWAAVCIAIMTCGTMFPMSAYTGKILLQVRETTIMFLYGHLSYNCVIMSTEKGVK